ncbi:uncharacterized protein LOC125532818 [Triticum urartu]|uniref:uncharacterized protein LOC125532818 n=1 Tax=Triticum urartu TaxID=4572 RepID=UPI00204471E9|nr:uncharacterized protein LOC125532818 [Triticum urartu]
MGRSSSSPVHPERRGRSYVVRGVDATHGGHPLHPPMDKKDPLDPLLTLAPTTPSLTPFRSLPSASGATQPLTTRPGTSLRYLGTARGPPSSSSSSPLPLDKPEPSLALAIDDIFAAYIAIVRRRLPPLLSTSGLPGHAPRVHNYETDATAAVPIDYGVDDPSFLPEQTESPSLQMIA